MQWFRGWANMMRWLEEFELKHVEFMRSIKSFERMSSVWAELASKTPLPGNAAFARKQSETFKTLSKDASDWFSRRPNHDFSP